MGVDDVLIEHVLPLVLLAAELAAVLDVDARTLGFAQMSQQGLLPGVALATGAADVGPLVAVAAARVAGCVHH